MTESTNGIRDITNQQLKNIYKKYTDYVINFELHVKKLYDDWVIDINNRNQILHNLDNMIRSMNKIYNYNLVKKYKNHASEDLISDTNTELSNISVANNICNGIEMLKILDMSYNDKSENPFHEIKTDLISLAEDNGYRTLDDFFKLYFNTEYMCLLDRHILELYDLYNKLFVPIGIVVKKYNKPSTDNNFVIKKKQSECDGLIDNTCTITIIISSLSLKFIFDGYICCDTLNTYTRTLQIYSKHIHSIMIDSKNIIKKQYPHISSTFLEKYSKMINSSCYFVNNTAELTEKILVDYEIFNVVCGKNFNLIMKDFIHSNIKTMFNIINLLLMGTEQNISTAVLLFNILKDKNINGKTLSDIIYNNLSFFSQTKLKKSTNTMKNELTRLKTLTPENISLEKRIASLVNMSDNVKSYILEKINEIKSGENNYKLQMAINGLMQFPWKPIGSKNEFSDIKKSMPKSRDFLMNVAKKLDNTVYGHDNSKKVLIELVGKWIQNPESTGQVIGLVGPPGIGKTLLAKSISNALGLPLSIVGLGGMSDSADLIGHSFTYAGAQYGMIIRQMIKAGNWRCVMFFDEVDKVSKRNDTNEIYNTLIHITDPNMNQHFQDRFYSSSIEFDLSGVLIVFSYNDSSKLDPILLDRVKEITISPYSTQEKISIIQSYVLKELCENIGFDRSKIHIDSDTIKYIIEKYTLEAGVRDLRRKIEQILLKLNIDRFYMRGPFVAIMKKIYAETIRTNNTDQHLSQVKINNINSDNFSSESKSGLAAYVEYKKSPYEELLGPDVLNNIFNLEFDNQIVITQDLIHKYLDKPVMMVEQIHYNDCVGIISGLYATAAGMGGVLPIQISKNFIGELCDDTNLKLKLTGNQKQVMRESVVVALTTAVSILNSSIKNNIVNIFPHGFHIHAPDGGTPKDGPSAGCAFATAFVSTLLNKKINRTVAMTGEIELTGKISRIGGLDAKLAGAKKAGVKTVYICEENKSDYEKIKKKNPELFDNQFEIKIIEHIIDIVTDPHVIIDVTASDFDSDIIAEYHRQKLSRKNDL